MIGRHLSPRQGSEPWLPAKEATLTSPRPMTARSRNAWRTVLLSGLVAAGLIAGAVQGVQAQGGALDLGVPVWNFVAPGAILVPQPGGAAWVAAASGYPAIVGEINPETGAAE